MNARSLLVTCARTVTYCVIALLLLVSPLSSDAQKRTGDRTLKLRGSEPIKSFPIGSRRYALVIGVDKYADTKLSTLGGSSNDARSLANALVQYAGFPGDQVTLLASDQPTERQPTRSNILWRLSNLISAIPPDGLLLISFAGHGIDRGGQAFLLPSDARVSNDVDLLEETAINVLQIKEKIRKIGVGQVLMIVDACRNDPTGRANVDNPLTASYTKAFNFDVRNREVKAFATLYATEVGHRAYEYKEKKQGYFTWSLVEGLKGGAANGKGEVTLAGLLAYLQDRVPRRVLQDLGGGKDQRPFAVVEGYRADELVISVGNAKTADVGPANVGTPSVSRSITPDVDPGVEVKERDVRPWLESTSWSGSLPSTGEYTVDFLKNGELHYTIMTIQNGVTAPRTAKGKWMQSGNSVQIIIGNSYSVWQGTVDGNTMKGEATNEEGAKWNWSLFRKQ
jgi:hypothetical protein